MLSIFYKQTVLTKEASGNSRQDRLGVNGFLMGFKERRILESVQWMGTAFYFPVNIYSCKQRNRCNQTVPTKISQDHPRPMLWDSIDLTKKSAATRSLNNIIPVLYSLDLINNVVIMVEVANMNQTQTKIKILDQPEEQMQIPEVVLEPEAMLPSNFHQ